MIESIGAGPQLSSAAEEVTNQTAISQEDFLEILLTQLSFQDPLKPLDNQEFIAQMAQFTNLEQTRQLSQNSETLLTVQSATQSIGLLGKSVDVQTDSGLKSDGTVTAIRFDRGVPTMTVLFGTDDFELNVRLADVQLVRN